MLVVIADHGEAAGAQGQRGVLPDIACCVGGSDAVAGIAVGIAAVQHLQVGGLALVTDHRLAVRRPAPTRCIVRTSLAASGVVMLSAAGGVASP